MESSKLQLGFGKLNITPDYPVGLSASGDEKRRRNTGIVSEVFATCLAVKFDGETYLIYTIDTISIDEPLGNIIRDEIMKQFPEIKREHIFLGATHGHSCPANKFDDEDVEGRYRREFIGYIPQAAKLALEDVAPATMEACKFQIPGMNFVRHYIMNDGTYAGPNFGDTSSGYKAHTYDVNHEMIMVRFPREGKEDVVLVNWAAHPANPYDKAIGNLNICADHPGWCRDELEKLSGAKVAYMNGASGDVIPWSHVPGLNHGLNAKEYGEKLGQIAFSHFDEFKPMEVDAIKTTQQVVQCKIEHKGEELSEQCKEICRIRWTEGNRTLSNQMARDIGLSSAYHAVAILFRKAMGEFQPRTVGAFRIGPVSFTTGTYEMASEHAGEIKAASPYEFTLQICANSKYIPREEAIDYCSYEGTSTFYVRETGDMLVEKYLEMLKEIQ